MPEPERDIIDITLRRSTRDTQVGYRAPTLSPQPKGPPKGVAPPPEYRFAVRRSGRPLYLTPTQRYMEEVAETSEGQRPETIPLTPDVEQELLKRGAPADVVGQFRQYGVPRDLLQQLPAPDRPGFLQRLLAFKPARYAAKGIDYALKPFQWTNENIDKPWAGFLLYAKERFQAGEQTVERAVKEEGFKKGLKAGYERAAIGTWGRFALEMSNPLWWIPVSAWAGGAKLGLKALAGAEVADRTAAALALAAKTTTSAVTRPLMKVPYIRTMVAESPHSSVLNAAPSTYDVLENVSRVYGELGKSNIDVLADIAAGKLSVPIVEKGVIQSGRQVKVLDQLLSKQITNVRNGQTRDVASILKVDELLPLAKTDYQAAVRVLAGRMRQATSRALNVQNVAPGEGLLHNVYEFWRSGVLWTPAFMLQNAIEDPIRTLIWTRRLPLYRGLADAAKEAGTPIQVQNLAQSASQYLHRGKTVGQTAAFLRRDIANLENQAKTLKAMKRPGDTVEWRIKSLKEELAELPQAAADVNVAPILGTDAVIRSSGAMANTWERTLVGFFGKVLEAPTKPFTKGESRERVGQAIRGGVRFAANFPHRVANYMDAAAMVRIYQHERGRFTKLLLKAEGPQKQELIDKFFADNAARWQKMGLSPEMVKGGQELAYGARNGADFGLQWQRAGADLFPEITDAVGKTQLPDDVKTRLISDLQNKVYAGDVDGIASMVKEYKVGLQGYQREFAERWQADMRAAIDERLRLMAEPDRLQAQALFRGLEKQLDIGPEEFLPKLKAEELGFEPEEALEQMLVWTRFNESAQQRQLIKQRFIVERLEKAAGKPEEWRELQAMLDRLDQNITRPNRISHQQFGSVTSQVLPRGRLTRIDWDSYIETVEKINPIFAMRLREMAPTRSNAWKNYRLGIADMFDNESLEIAAYLGVDDSLIQGGYVKRLLQQGQAELDDLEKMAQKIAAVPPAIDDKARAMKDIELGVGKLFGENEDAILSTAALSNKASAMAESSMYAVMGNYGKTRGFDDAMRPVFPFFYFPSRSIPFYLRTGIEYPWTLRSYLTYEELTREPDRPASLLGYVKLSDGVYINPFRPWAGAQIFGREPLSGIGQPIAEQVSTALGMMGLSFQPGVTLGTEMASRLSEAIGGPQLTRGEPRPIFPQLTWMKAAAQAATGIPVLEPTQMMLGQAKWPAWYQRQIEKELANMGVDAARAMSSRATDEDKEAVQRAMKITGQKELTRAVAPIRFRHTKEIKMYAELSQALEAYGISKQQQAEIREQGLNPAQYLNNQQRRQMYQAHPDWEVWQGLTSPFLSMKEQQVWEQTRNFWLDYSDVADQLEVQQREDTKRVQLYQISKQEWRLNYQYRQQEKQAAYDMARRIYKGALVDNEAIDAYRREYGRPLPPLRMEDVAVQLYYDMNAPIDPVTRQPDFNELDARRDEFLDMLPPVIREYVIGEVDRPRVEADAVESEWRSDRRRLKPWSQLRSQVVRTRPNWEAMLDNYAYARSADPPLADRIRKSGDFKGYQQALKRAREEMRMADAELEYLLIKWGLSNISKPLNPMTVQFIRRGY